MLGLRAIGQGSGGVEKAVEELSVRLTARGHEVTVFCRKRYNPGNATSYQGVHLVNLPAVYTKHLEAISHTALAACRVLRGFDVVHIHATGPSMLSFIPRLARRKVVVTVHRLDWKSEKWRGLAKPILRLGAWTAIHFPHKTIVVSRQLERHYAEQHGRETVYIPNGVSPGARRPVQALRRLGVTGDDYILYLGRLVPEKGCHLLIDALRQLDTKKKLLVVGETSHSDAYVDRLRSMAEGDNRVVFAGALYGDEKDEAYSNATCLVFPSTLEGMPIVLLEAMSYGCPVLCSDIPENLEVVKPGPHADFAATFQSGSTDDLAGRLQDLLANADRARQMADDAQAYVGRAFTWDAAATETERLYESLL
jgi:glycosyltransferase involved in cell wall biosynthesis